MKEESLMEKFGLKGAMDEMCKKIAMQSDEIVIAFIAKYGCHPEQVIQVMGKCDCGIGINRFALTDELSYERGKLEGFKQGYIAAKNEIKETLGMADEHKN